MVRTYIKDGCEYTASNHRMRYNPEFCGNHGRAFTVSDLIYLCSMYESTKKADLAMALGRTQSTIMTKVYTLRKNGQFDYYKKLGQAKS